LMVGDRSEAGASRRESPSSDSSEWEEREWERLEEEAGWKTEADEDRPRREGARPERVRCFAVAAAVVDWWE
jgi:hypothetical protein